jgi:cytochrome c553
MPNVTNPVMTRVKPRPARVRSVLAALLLTATGSTTAFAQDTAAPAAQPAAIVGNAAHGKTLIYTCVGCHGLTGYKNAYPNYHVPLIGGQPEQYLINALTEYRSGARKHPTMQAQASGFSDQDIADIATFLSSLKQN